MIMKEPLVSIVIPMYNGSKYIVEALKSAIKQTHRNIEIIVIDDGSTDSTKDVVDEMISKNSLNNIRYAYQKNSGSAVARNKGIGLSRGEYIALLDQDDIYENNKIAEQVKLFEDNNDLGLVFCNANIIDKNYKIIKEVKYDEDLIKNGFIEILRRCFILSPSLIMVRKKVLDEVGIYDESLWYSDWELYVRILKKFKLGFVQKPFVKYRLHDSNTMKNINVQNKYTLKKLNKIWSDPSLLRYSSLRREVYTREMYDLGVDNFEIFQISEARKCFFVALKNCPFNLKCLVALIKTFLPARLYLLLKRLKNDININKG